MKKRQDERAFPERERSGGTQQDDGRGRSPKAEEAVKAGERDQPAPGRSGYAGFGDDFYLKDAAPVEERKPKTATKRKPR